VKFFFLEVIMKIITITNRNKKILFWYKSAEESLYLILLEWGVTGEGDLLLHFYGAGDF